MLVYSIWIYFESVFMLKSYAKQPKFAEMGHFVAEYDRFCKKKATVVACGNFFPTV